MPCAGSKSAGEVSMVRERVSGWLYLLGWTVVCRMPRRWAQWMFRQIADQLWRRQGPGVRQLEANLARVIGPDASVMDLRRLSRDGMRSYLRYWLEVFRLPVIPPAEILGRMRAAGEEQTAFRHLAAGRGVDLRAAAHGQLGARGRLDRAPRRREGHHSGGAAAPGIAV